MLLDAFERSAPARDLFERLPGRGASLTIGGLAGSSGAVLAATLVRAAPQRLVVIVTPTPADAERWLTDLQFLSEAAIALYPQREALGEDEPHYEIAGERVETIEALLGGRLRLVVTTARAVAERTLVPAALEASRVRLAKGTRIRPQALALSLESMGFRRVTTVTEVAEFSARGGIVDVYGFGMASAARLEWWDNEVSSLRAFDLTTQRSGAELDEVTILPVRSTSAEVPAATGSADATAPSRRRSLLDLLPSDALLLLDAPGPIADEIERAWREAAHHLEIARRLGEDVPQRDEILEAPEQVQARLAASPQLRLVTENAALQFGFLPPEQIDRQVNRLRDLLSRPARHDHSLRQRGPDRAARRAARGTRPGAGSCDAGGGRARWRIPDARASGPYRPRNIPARPAAPARPPLPAGRTLGRDRRAGQGRLRRPSRSRHRDLSGDRDDHGRRIHHGSRRGRVRGRGPPQRTALSPGPARALSRGRGGWRPATAADPQPGWLALEEGAGEGTAGHTADGRRAARPLCAPPAGDRIRLPAGHALAARTRVQLPL